jgi:hypothetical protein
MIVLRNKRSHSLEHLPKEEVAATKSLRDQKRVPGLSKSGALVSAAALMLSLSMSNSAQAALTDFNMTWTNTGNPADSFSGVLHADSALFSNSGPVNLATTSATFSVVVPQISATYTMADFGTFKTWITQTTASNFTVGENLLSPNVMGSDLQLFGKITSAAFNNFNSCNMAYGVCFNRFGAGPTYQLTNMTVAAPVPEPETFSMMALGLGLLGFVSRRRKNNRG